MFIIDFDDTLFNTHVFKKARIEALRVVGVSEENYHETYAQALKENELFSYSNERHVDMLSLRGYQKERVLRALEETTGAQLQNFLFPDTIEFLEKLKTLGKSMVLLSLGNPGFQELKVKGSGIEQYFGRRFMVTESKEYVIQELITVGEKEDEMWFINDKVEETLLIKNRFSKLNIVLKQSPSINEEDYIRSNLPHFQTLTEIYEYIEQKNR